MRVLFDLYGFDFYTQVLSRLVGGTPNERDFQSLVSEFDDQDFAKRQCNTRTILEKVARRCTCTLYVLSFVYNN